MYPVLKRTINIQFFSSSKLFWNWEFQIWKGAKIIGQGGYRKIGGGLHAVVVDIRIGSAQSVAHVGASVRVCVCARALHVGAKYNMTEFGVGGYGHY